MRGGRRRPIHKFEIHILEDREVGRDVPRFLHTMANRTGARASNGPFPTSLDPFCSIGG